MSLTFDIFSDWSSLQSLWPSSLAVLARLIRREGMFIDSMERVGVDICLVLFVADGIREVLANCWFSHNEYFVNPHDMMIIAPLRLKLTCFYAVLQINAGLRCESYRICSDFLLTLKTHARGSVHCL